MHTFKMKHFVFPLHEAVSALEGSPLLPCPSIPLSHPWCQACLTFCLSHSFYLLARHSSANVGWDLHNGNVIIWCCIIWICFFFSAYYHNYAVDMCIARWSQGCGVIRLRATWKSILPPSPSFPVWGVKALAILRSRFGIMPSERCLL